jgi:hypothetical protein
MLGIITVLSFNLLEYTQPISVENALFRYSKHLFVDQNLHHDSKRTVEAKDTASIRRWWDCIHYGIENPVISTDNEFIIELDRVIPVSHQHVVDGVEAFGFTNQIGVFKVWSGEVYLVSCGENVNINPYETRVDITGSNVIARMFEFIMTYVTRLDLAFWRTYPQAALRATHTTVADPGVLYQYKTWFKPLSITMGFISSRWQYFDYMLYDPHSKLSVVPENILSRVVFVHAWADFPLYWAEHLLANNNPKTSSEVSW